MSFTSGSYYLYLVLFLLIYWAVPHLAWQNLLLLAASYLFYGWVHPWYAGLLGVSTLADYGLSRLLLRRPDRRRVWLALSLLVNLGVLAFFKYYGFFSRDLARAVSSLGLDGSGLLVQIILPVGLSFYTLKKLAYVLDVSRGTTRPASGLVAFALYVGFFPQIAAGPIDRARTLLPQIEQPRTWKSGWFHTAWPLLVSGLFKKFVVADSLKVIVDRVYQVDQPTWILILAATLAFAVQILADFSAYTDLARGVARLLGFETSENFRRPFLSLTPTDFWNRWHITLSHWLRDYVFFPLRRSMLRLKWSPGILTVVLPPLATMLLCGLWHGAGWTFALWGLFHGLLIAGYQLAGLGGDWKPRTRPAAAAAWLAMSGFTLFGWLLFRAPSPGWLADLLLKAPWSNGPHDVTVALLAVSMILLYGLPLALLPLADRLRGGWSWLGGVVYAVLLAAVVVYLDPAPPDFIYVRF